MIGFGFPGVLVIIGGICWRPNVVTSFVSVGLLVLWLLGAKDIYVQRYSWAFPMDGDTVRRCPPSAVLFSCLYAVWLLANALAPMVCCFRWQDSACSL